MICYSALNEIGRLGNQLFALASITGIAEKTDTKASFPKWKYERYFKHPLPHEQITDTVEIKERHFHFDEGLVNLRGFTNYDIHGYLQSEKYWNKETTLKLFEFDDRLKDTVVSLYKSPLSKSHVAISVRRGDFVNNPNYFQLPIAYYLNAYYTHFNGHVPIIFSDDIDYCKKHFRAIEGAVFADLNDIEQLCLMSLCQNHIISNSTFSWWGAYLGQRAIGNEQWAMGNEQVVIRPEKNFAGKLAILNSEEDYWPADWWISNEYRLDLSDTTFVIPVYHDHSDRMQNLMLTLAFLNTHFRTNILIGEQGGNAFEHLSEYANYIQFDLAHFHRTKMINELVKAANTPIVVNWDSDNICTPAQLYEAVKAIRDGADIAYPFDGTVYRVPRFLFNQVAEALDVFYIDDRMCREKRSSVGHAVVMDKESFISAGMENEHFVSWTPEDSERFNRFHILGMNIKRIAGAIYHMDHYVGVNSSNKNPFFREGEKEFLKVATMKKQQLQDYIKTWSWVN